MLKKIMMFGLIALNAFTLRSVDAQVPETYQEINFNSFVFDGSFLEGAQTDSVYFDLWTFINFQTATIEIDGFTVVDLGQPIDGASYFYDIVGGNHFKLLYDDRTYLFSLEILDIEGIGTIPAYTVFARAVSPPPLESDLSVTIYLDNPENIAQPEVSGGFLELLVGYGIFNTTGLLLLLFVVLLVINIILVFIKVPNVVYIVANSVIMIGFITFNLVPAWASFLFLAISALFLIIMMKGDQM